MTRADERRRFAVALLAAALAAAVVSCAGIETEAQYPEKRDGRAVPAPRSERQTLFGPDGITHFRRGDGGDADAALAGTADAYLWRAALETLSTMPLAAADRVGGVVITEWYSAPETPERRLKATVLILAREPSADAIKVSVFRQRRVGAEAWRDDGTSAETATALADAIVTRARRLRADAGEG